MNKIAMLMIMIFGVFSVNAQELKPLPNMTSAKISKPKDAQDIILKKIIADANDGLSATESIIAKLSFTLGSDLSPFGKKGDRVWQIHRVRLFAQTTNIYWVNAETGLVRSIYPPKPRKIKEEKVEQN